MSLPETTGREPPKKIVPEVEKALKDESLPIEFRNLPKDVRHEVVQTLSSVAIKVSHESWEGHYPSPQMLAGYRNVGSDLPDRIFTMAESDLAATHRHNDEVARYMHRGQIFGFILAAMALLGSIILLILDKTLPGALLGGAVLIPLVTLFVTGQLAGKAPEPPPAPTPPTAKTGDKKNSQRRR